MVGKRRQDGWQTLQNVTILATRKTAPGLRYFDKKAVVLGGGATHRMRLDDMVLIKDNHLALVSDLGKAIRLARKNVGSSVKVECEARTKEEALAVVAAKADIVMLDNFTPKEAQQTIREITRMGLRNKVKIELSGGINQKNVGITREPNLTLFHWATLHTHPKQLILVLKL